MAYETHGVIVITAKRVPSNLRSKFPNTARVPDLARNVQCNNSPRHLRVFLADRRASFLADCARHPGSFHEMDRRLISGAVQTAILRQKFYTLWCKRLASKHHIHSRFTGNLSSRRSRSADRPDYWRLVPKSSQDSGSVLQ
jgi:hypothetical protein